MVVSAIAASSLALAACGTDNGQPEHVLRGSTATVSSSTDPMAGMDMGDATLKQAKDIPGATLITAAFTLLDTRPPGTDAVTGTAWLAHGPNTGTTVTIELRNLPPGQYVAHVHASPCSAGNGGKHFQFHPGEPAMPPNEIHLGFSAGPDGKGFMTANNNNDVGTGAKAVVVHPAEALDSRLACADF